jgi:hypothetical protein
MQRSGFTLVEVILASIILCGTVLALGAISTRSMGQTRLNRQYEIAAALADKQLTMIDYIGVDYFIELGQRSGEFDEYDPPYTWQVGTEYLEIDELYKATVTIGWVDAGRPYSIAIETRLEGATTLVPEEEPIPGE